MQTREPVTAVIFDLGKTLMYIPEEYNIESRISQISDRSRQEIEILFWDICYRKPGISEDDFVNEVCREVAGESNQMVEQIRVFVEDSVRGAKLQDGATEALSTLKNRGYRLALVSNTSPLSKSRIRRLNIHEYFDQIVFSCDVGYLKPDPRIFMRAVQLLGVNPESVCVVGDRLKTLILGAKNINAKTVLFDRRFDNSVISEQIPVDAIVPDFSALLDLPMLKRISND